MTEKKSAVRIVCGLDVGNGYLKGRAKVDGGEPVNVDMPSVVTRAKGDTVPQEEDEAHVSALPNSLDATVVSRAAGPSGRYLFGTRAVDSGRSNVEFSIDSPDPKCNDPLSTLLVLGVVASLAVRRAFETGAGDDLDVTCTLAAALPIGDYVRFRGSYRGNLMGCSHEVVVHNFDRDIRVRVTFDDVVVLAEGAAAQYAIQSLGPVFLQTAVDAARAEGYAIDDAYTGDMLAESADTIGVDVGEGTTNFPVFRAGDLSTDSSGSINRGYGTVLEEVVDEVRNTPYAFDSRKALAAFMLRDPKSLKPAQLRVREAVEAAHGQAVEAYVRDVISEYSRIWRRVGNTTDVVYVYGGGAAAVKDRLMPALMHASTLAGGSSVPVVYIDSRYSRSMNRNGLYEAACMVAGD